MSKQKVTLEVDVPEGFKLTGEFRPPKKGENYLINRGRVIEALDDYDEGALFLIVEPEEPPLVEGPLGWPKLQWAAENPDGCWTLYEQEPIRGKDGTWHASAGVSVSAGTSTKSVYWAPPREHQDKELLRLKTWCEWTWEDNCWRAECQGSKSTEHKDIPGRYCPYCGKRIY